MEKSKILKKMGFSDSYIKELEDYNENTPIIEIRNQYEENLEFVTSDQADTSFSIVSNNENYSKNLVVRII